MVQVEGNTPAVGALSWLVARAQDIRGKLVVYVALITAFWASLFLSVKGMEPLLGPPPKGREPAWYAKAVGIGLGFPTGALLLAEGLPAFLQWRRDRRLERRGIQGPASQGYFQLTPYERQDRERFRRADLAHDDILAWLRREGPAILYLSGRSGAGKSSLLNASVLPGLESGDPPWVTLTLRGFGDPVADLAAGLRKPGPIYKNPPRDLPTEIRPLLRKIDDRLEKEGRHLLVLIDQFEEFPIFHDREPERQQPFLSLLSDLHRDPPKRIRLLLAFRSDYEGDISRLDLPRLQQDGNWKQVDSFTENQARDFLLGGFEGPKLGTDLLSEVVRHASELDETRGKIRPVVLNMIGLALAARGGQAGRVIGPRGSQRLMLDHVRDCLKDPLARDHAPRVLGQMVTPEGRKQRPTSAPDLARATGLGVSLIQGCLTRLDRLGLVRTFDSDARHSAETQVWEIAHDFVARLLSLILPGWKPSIWARLGRALLGPTLILGVAALPVINQVRRYQRIERLQKWVAIYDGTIQLTDDGTFKVRLQSTRNKKLDFADVAQDGPWTCARLISSLNLSDLGPTTLPPEIGKLTGLTELNLSNNVLETLPPEIGKLTGLTELDLSNNVLTTLPPEIGKLTGLTRLDLSFNPMPKLPPVIGELTRLTDLDFSFNKIAKLPPEIGKLTRLIKLNLSGNDSLKYPPPAEIIAQGTQAVLRYYIRENPPPTPQNNPATTSPGKPTPHP